MTTKEKFNLIPQHYLPKFINATLVSLSIPQYISFDIDKANVTIGNGWVQFIINNTHIRLSTFINSVDINIL